MAHFIFDSEYDAINRSDKDRLDYFFTKLAFITLILVAVAFIGGYKLGVSETKDHLKAELERQK